MSRTRTGRTLPRLLALAAVATVLFLIAAHYGTTPAAPGKTAPSAGHDSTPNATAALTQLATLRVLPSRPHHAGYQRGCGRGQACSFGPAWTDNTTAPGGHNGCDTRNDILRTQLTGATYRPGSRCVVVAGTLHDPYTGRTIAFAKAHASLVQIDHLVPLALAWDLGANAWPQPERAAYANDEHLVLLAVDGTANDAKGDDGPAAWMPPNTSYRATYAAGFIAVLAHYRLPVTAADKTALTTALEGTHR
ncbi:MAG TPA: HNH endonuclease family protein [Jatrophihabitantaceae bacterium]|jgi:hypothetical protein